MNITERMKSYEPLWENWYLDEYIGSGASGAVYRLKQDRFGKTAYSAVKVISLTLDKSVTFQDKEKYMDELRRRAEIEIENMYLMKECPYIVHCNNHAIKNVGKSFVDILIQMDLHTCLVNYLEEYGMLTEKNVLRLAMNIGTALKAVHDQGIIHRDVKPMNIFVRDNGDFLLGDFGVSRSDYTEMYRTRIGTEPFIAPEVWNSSGKASYTYSADIYSFGILLYMLMNENYLPLVDENSSLNDISKAVSERLSGAEFGEPRYGSDEFKKIIMRLCAFDVKNRYSDMTEVMNDLCIVNDLLSKKDVPWNIDENGMLTINSFSDMGYKEYASDTEAIVLSEDIDTIPENAFKGFKVRTVILPVRLKVIENSAFSGCKELKNIDFGRCRQLERIDKKAFAMCIALEKIDLSQCENLKKVDNRAFWYCKSLNTAGTISS